MYNNFDDAKYQNKHSMYNAGNSVFSGNVTAGMADEINFYQWLNRNYSKSGIFSSQKSMQNYLNGGSGQEKLFKNIIQGKGHEHDWMSTQRRNPLNIDKMYDAGDIANRPGSDVTQISVFTGKEKAVQIKAYGSDNIPDLHNTPTDMTVVVNAEKADAVAKKGYIDVEVFGTAKDIKNKTQSRLNRIKNGKIYTKHRISVF